MFRGVLNYTSEGQELPKEFSHPNRGEHQIAYENGGKYFNSQL